MSRVKFNVNTEYAYIQNFKLLQSQSALRSQRVLSRKTLTRDRLLRTSWSRSDSARRIPREVQDAGQS